VRLTSASSGADWDQGTDGGQRAAVGMVCVGVAFVGMRMVVRVGVAGLVQVLGFGLMLVRLLGLVRGTRSGVAE